ncbi:MAG TPA: magnesium chelatase subunit D family protein [Candidatus Dormibacteraeota bacterium]|nr:magnesium chelatase subunit D family protein [Candidatus Dormibacteraeota bacterium]
MATTLDRHSFPFTAIVGQDSMKLALILNAIVPAIGGVLIRGEKGTGKSTAVRALAKLLPEHTVVEGCHFGCDPADLEALCADCRLRLAEHGHLPSHARRMRVVELPINASEDRVVGTIDIEAALRTGARRFEPGVLAEANRNILYVDEVNLLDDHLVDVLLDAAAMGINVVEREGVSFSHPSRFILVGTMNPEEGELRPQLLDRFGLCVDVEGIRDPDERVLIAERDAAFKRGDHEFMNEFAAADHNLSRALAEAIAAVSDVKVTQAQTRLITSICVEADVLGHRADVVIDRAVRALAAYRRHDSPTREDVYDAATLALAHRARKPLRREEDESTTPERSDDQEGDKPNDSEASEPQASDSQAQAEASADESSSASDSGEQSAGSDRGMTTGGSSGHESSPEAAEIFNLRRIDLPRQRRVRKQGGKRAASQTPDRRGRYVRAEPKAKVNDLAIDATVRAAAPMQKDRGRREGERLLLEREDLRQKVRERKVGNLIVFVVDASASMDAEQRMAATKGAILSLLQDAYVRRDRVAVVIFKNRTAEVVLRPTSSVSLARRRLEKLSVGGTTPLTHGLMAGYKVVKTELLRDQTIRPLLVLISDGRGNISMFKEEPLVEAQRVAALIESEQIDCLVIDSARDYSHLPSVQHLARVAPMYQTYAINACADLAERMGARYYGLYDLSRDEIASAVERELGRGR